MRPKICVVYDDPAVADTLSTHLSSLAHVTNDLTQKIDFLVLGLSSRDLTCKIDFSNVRCIFVLAAGVRAVLEDGSIPREIPVVKLCDAGMGKLIEEYVQYGLLHFRRDFDLYGLQQRSCVWRASPKIDTRLDECSVCVLGLGHLGSRIAQSLRVQGYRVLGWARTAHSEEGIECYSGREELLTAVKDCNFLVCLLPASASTDGLIDRRVFEALADGAVFINCGRGACVNYVDLISCCETRKIRGALLDVFDPQEPLPEQHALWKCPGVIVTPHIAAVTPAVQAATQIAGKIREIIVQGKKVQDLEGYVRREHGY